MNYVSPTLGIITNHAPSTTPTVKTQKVKATPLAGYQPHLGEAKTRGIRSKQAMGEIPFKISNFPMPQTRCGTHVPLSANTRYIVLFMMTTCREGLPKAYNASPQRQGEGPRHCYSP